ncbi:MAG TPA: ABC transporter permease [Peptococcaceae bacterium]|nr:ABC transporter permease [Peptococcaceae bacterium]
MKTIAKIARKEFGAFFASPTAFIFLAVFLAVTLFVFFWVETFFANNIAEVRPLFSWMPILLIFLTSAITMRLWAEERRSGTLEFLLTSAVNPLWLVAGKFLACMGLVGVSLLLTIFVPVTVSFMGPLDWGPVIGGYIASFFLAAAYVSIGLYVSSRSENQIVSLILSTVICGIFYLLGSDILTAFLGTKGAEILKFLGSGSRFESITRGVIDLRDLYYYLALVGVFLSLNVYSLEKTRWAGNPANSHHRLWQAATLLLVANFLTCNLWLVPLGFLRADMTKGNIYSISDATRGYLSGLQEPLLIRGYFSAKTHPLLAPLVPRLKDLLQEYAVAGGKKLRVEFVDPIENQELEEEAGQKYGIKPVPFQTASKYQAAITNSYFDILVKYGDQFEVLGFRDLIEIKARSEEDIDVELRNPEYDITRAIKKVLYAYQGGGDLFANINKDVTLTGYFSQDENLPKELVQLKKDLQDIAADMGKDTDFFTFNIVDPDADDGTIAKKINTEFGFRPMAASLFDQRTFWFYMTMASGDQVLEIPLPGELNKESLRRSVEAGLKRFAAGFMKTVALHTPPSTPPMPQYGIPSQGKRFNWLQDFLTQDHTVVNTDLEDGQVPEEADILLLASPKAVTDKQLFAIDQFLMRGGTVVLATSPFDVNLSRDLSVAKQDSGLEQWLAFHGLSMSDEMVLDPQNSAFPIPVQRRVAGFIVQETRMVDYPYFVDIRPDGMNQESGMFAGLNQVTLNWASPIHVDDGKNKDKKVLRLLESSNASWVSESTAIQPDFQRHGQLGFPLGKEQPGKQLLGVAIEGSFVSYFKDKPSPLLPEEKNAENKDSEDGAASDETAEEKEEKEQIITRLIEKSPESSRIILFSSASFLNDTALEIASAAMRTRYLAPVQLMANTIDWSLEDKGLLSIRGRGHFARPLMPMDKKVRMFWEYLNYGLAVAGLFLVFLTRLILGKRAARRYQLILAQDTGRA